MWAVDSLGALSLGVLTSNVSENLKQCELKKKKLDLGNLNYEVSDLSSLRFKNG